MISPFSLSTIALALASICVATPVKLAKRDFTVIGYRTVNGFEGKEINKVGWLYYHQAFDNLMQLGNGKSLSGSAGSWDVGNGNMYCIVLADEGALASITKAWIPETFDGGALWFSSEKIIQNYIKSGEVSAESQDWDASRTLRFAQVMGKNFDECFIPNALLGDELSNGPLYMFAECYDSVDAMRVEHNVVDIDYNTWNILGPKTDPVNQ